MLSKIKFLGLAIIAIGVIVSFSQSSKAGGDYSTAQWVYKGNYTSTRQITVSSGSITNLFNWDGKRADSICYNNSTYTLWVGSATAPSIAVIQAKGFPIAAYSYFTINGALPGISVCTADATALTIDVRCMDGEAN